LFKTGWFAESLMTQTLIIQVVRSNYQCQPMKSTGGYGWRNSSASTPQRAGLIYASLITNMESTTAQEG